MPNTREKVIGVTAPTEFLDLIKIPRQAKKTKNLTEILQIEVVTPMCIFFQRKNLDY